MLLFLLVTLGCILWTLWLSLLTASPNASINRVMNTTNYDNGAFWLLIEPSPDIQRGGVFGFAMVLAGYLVVILTLTCSTGSGSSRKSSRFFSATSTRLKASLASNTAASFHRSFSENPSDSKWKAAMKRVVRLMLKLTDEEGERRQLANLALKAGDFALQVALIVQYLENGQPVALIGLLTVIVVLNSTACALMIWLKPLQSGFVQLVICCTFDFLIVVAFPMTVVMHSLNTFAFDRKKLAINEAIYPPGTFDRSARVSANPVQVAVALDSLNSLRIVSIFTFFVRVGTNLTLCFEFATLARRLRLRQSATMFPYRHRAALVFVALPGAIIVYVAMSVKTSETACLPHPECAVHANRWIILREDDKSQCPCLTIIDADRAPRTYAEWLSPKNLSEKVAQLASSGDLHTLDLTNRMLAVLPDELRGCRHMKYISLMYTHTETLPVWTSEFAQLEYLHIEGTLDHPSLTSVPDGLFDNMASLTFLHLGGLPNLRQLPRFDGLVNVKAMMLGQMLSMTELPALTSLSKLERLSLVSAFSLDSMPDMSPIRRLVGFTITSRGTICCNGFRDNKCNFTDPWCPLHPSWNFPQPTCLPVNRTSKLPTPATLAQFARFPASVCATSAKNSVKTDEYPTREGVVTCNGTQYQQCQKAGTNATGMCYSLRLMAIACTTDMLRQTMRRRQIQENVGDPCDPTYESWLGCAS